MILISYNCIIIPRCYECYIKILKQLSASFWILLISEIQTPIDENAPQWRFGYFFNSILNVVPFPTSVLFTNILPS